ncbi:MAG: Gfo/Idh/MocA family oxidoreductase [Pirellulaceae bacterium]|nr:Gfo/Idh/MocA family oxidoreductase [Pirellulaceae bacterium]
MRHFKAAVVGTGFIGPVHVEGLRRAGVEVGGIVGSSAQKSRQAAARLGLPAAYGTLDDVLADPQVDAVHIATPNRLHFAQVKAALLAGKHVLCEKPLAMNSAESAELVRLAGQCGRAAGVSYNIRFYPLCHEAAERVQRAELGDVLHVTGSYVQDWLLHDTDFNWRVLAEDGGPLRAVADIGTHWLDLIQFITGQAVVAVCADLRTVHARRRRPAGAVETFTGADGSRGESAADSVPVDTEDCGCVMLRLAGGANGCLWVSQVTAGRKNCLRYEIAGSRSALAWDSESPNQLWIGHRQSSNELLLRDPALMSDRASRLANCPGGHNEGFPDTFKQLFGCFYDYLAANDASAAPPFPTFADGHREIVLCEAILQSHRERRWVELPN